MLLLSRLRDRRETLLPGPGFERNSRCHFLGLLRVTLCSATVLPDFTTLSGRMDGRAAAEIWRTRATCGSFERVLQQTGQGQSHSDLGTVGDLSVVQFPHL